MKKFNLFKNRKRNSSTEKTLNNNEQEIKDLNMLNETTMNVDRHIYTYSLFIKEYPVIPFMGFSLMAMFKDIYIAHIKPNQACFAKNIFNRLPALKWLYNYNFLADFPADFLAGITVGIMHIPQGMGYSLLASLPPIYGLYTSFFPVVIYWIFGTSKHISIGTFAVVSLMVASTLASLEHKYVPPEGFNKTLNLETKEVDDTHFLNENRERARILIVMANAFWVGIIQIVMFFFQFGFVTSYLSEPFINSFLAG